MKTAEEPTPLFEEILKIDVHSHVFDDVPELVQMMARTNTKIVNVCVTDDPEEVKPQELQAEEIYAKYGSNFCFASTFDASRWNAPDFTNTTLAWLDKSFDAGAMMTKIWKNVGMELKTPEGAFLMPDDPAFDPIYAHLAKRGKPLMAHLAEPLDAWLPLDPDSVHYGYYSEHPEWHVYQREGFPSHEQLMDARDNILKKHPNLIVIGAHMGSMARDVDEVARRLDAYPNFYVDVSARVRDLERQPRDKVRNFFIKYQDRILYGYDLAPCYFPRTGEIPEDRRTGYTKMVESVYRTHYEYFAGRGTAGLDQTAEESLDLPTEVLQKFYHGNALRLLPPLAE
jgi:predicted TIM-barrel fold metal-dependent hydrolase